MECERPLSLSEFHMQHWPHAPPHRTLEKGTYMVTAATYNKTLHFHTPERLQVLHDSLLELATEYPWCSASWFEKSTLSAFNKTVFSFKIDKVNVIDDF